MAAAAPALIDRVEPNCSMWRTTSHSAAHRLGQPRPLLTEDEDAPPRQVVGLERHGAREVVDADDDESLAPRPPGEGRRVQVVVLVLVAVGHHRPATVPATLADDVEGLGVEGIRRADDRPDVEVVAPVLDGDVEVVASRVEVGDDRLLPPVAVGVDDVAAVTVLGEVGVPVVAGRPLARPRPYADALGRLGGRPVAPGSSSRRQGSGRRRSRPIHPLRSRAERLPLEPMHALAALAPVTLGPDWMDPAYLLEQYGEAFFWISLAIVFIECGLLFPILPGDSLLFAVGLFIATGQVDVNLGVAVVALCVAAFARQRRGLRDRAGYRHTALQRDGRVLKKKYFDQTTAFFDKHGNKALVIGRFVPIVRTFITVVAGVSRMDRRRFFTWSAVGAVLWAAG